MSAADAHDESRWERARSPFPPRPTAEHVAQLHASLLRWYDAHKRPLPWRVDRDPYRVWISEAMLQQTRVEAVLPYYERFLARFPSLRALADAPLEDVLAAWSGLGYYRRARTLHAAARTIVHELAGRFPREKRALLELPGIGPYTAGAILSIAFDDPEPLVDGNVARVFCRVFGLAGEPSSPALTRELWERASELVPGRGRAGDWNQALMELGALVCTPREPRCDPCPLSARCTARAQDRIHELPWPKARPAPVEVNLSILVVRAGDRVLLEQRPLVGRMAGMWQMPTIEHADGTADERADVAHERPDVVLERADVDREHSDFERERASVRREPASAALLFPHRWPTVAEAGDARPLLREGNVLGAIRHTITRHRIRAVVLRGALQARAVPFPYAWFRGSELAALALTGMTRKVLRASFFDAATFDFDAAASVELD